MAAARRVRTAPARIEVRATAATLLIRARGEPFEVVCEDHRRDADEAEAELAGAAEGDRVADSQPVGGGPDRHDRLAGFDLVPELGEQPGRSPRMQTELRRDFMLRVARAERLANLLDRLPRSRAQARPANPPRQGRAVLRQAERRG